jgi:hypothetical protein
MNDGAIGCIKSRSEKSRADASWALMRSYHPVILKGFHDAMENESATHGGDKKPNDAGNKGPTRSMTFRA